MAQHGGKRAGAGRKPGSKSRLTKANRATLTELALSYSESAMRVLRDIAEDETQSAAARVSAANSILDRALGKPAAIVDEGDGDAPGLTININAKPPVGDVRVTRSDG